MSLFSILDVAGSALTAQSQRLNTTASNLANAESVSGDPTKATKAIGEAIVKIKIDNAVAQIRASLATPEKLP